MMVGRDVVLTSQRREHAFRRVVLVEHLSYKDGEGRQKLNDINLSVRAGGIVGVAGVEGIMASSSWSTPWWGCSSPARGASACRARISPARPSLTAAG